MSGRNFRQGATELSSIGTILAEIALEAQVKDV
jgi:hypothetical protein